MTYQMDQAANISIADVVRGMMRRKLLMATTCLLGLAAGYLVSRSIDPSYQTEARIIVESAATTLDANQPQGEGALGDAGDRVVASQVSVIESSDLASRVIEKLKLAANTEYLQPLKEYGAIKSFAVSWGFSDDMRKYSPEQRALRQIKDDITVYNLPTSNVIGIKVTAGNPDLAAKIANTLADTYVLTTQENQSGSMSRAETWIADQIDSLKNKVAESEAAAEQFRSDSGLIKGANSTLGTQEITEVVTQLTLAEAAETEAAARAKEIKALLSRKQNVGDATSVLSSETIQALQQQRIQATRQFNELSAVYLTNHPKIVAARQQIRDIDSQIRREAQQVLEGLDGQAKIAAARAESLRQNLETLKQRESAASLNDVKLKALEREANANRQLLESMLARMADASTRKDPDVQPALARVIQRAQVPVSIYSPKKGPIILLSTLCGLVMGAGLAFLLSLLNPAGNPSPRPEARNWRDDPGFAKRTVNESQETPRPAASNFAQRDPSAPVAPAPTVSPPPILTPVITSPIVPASIPATVTSSVDTSNVRPSVAPTISAVERVMQTGRADFASATAAMPEPSGSLSRWADGNGIQHTTPPIVPGQISVDDFDKDEAESIAASITKIQSKTGAVSFAFARIGCRPFDSALAVMSAARELSNNKKRIMVFDLDQERAELENAFNLPDGPGLLDLLAGTADFTKIVNRDPESAVQIVRLGEVDRMPAKAELMIRIASILKSMKGIYDCVIVNCGEASPVTHGLITTCDAAVIIAPPSHDEQSSLAADSLTQQSGMPVLQISIEKRVDA